MPKMKNLVDVVDLQKMVEYEPDPRNVALGNSIPCIIFTRLKNKARTRLTQSEFELLVNLIKLEELAWIIVRDKQVKERYVKLWRKTRSIAADIIEENKIESDLPALKSEASSPQRGD